MYSGRRIVCILMVVMMLGIAAYASTTKILAQGGNPALQRCTPSVDNTLAATGAAGGASNATAEAGNSQPTLYVVTLPVCGEIRSITLPSMAPVWESKRAPDAQMLPSGPVVMFPGRLSAMWSRIAPLGETEARMPSCEK